MKKTPYTHFKIRKRKLQLDSLPGLKGQYRYLRREEFFADFAALRHQFFITDQGQPQAELNLAALTPDEIRTHLSNLGLPAELETHVIWCSDEEGAAIPFGQFTAIFNDLWSPNQDDVWVTPPTHDWLLELDQEQTLRFWKR